MIQISELAAMVILETLEASGVGPDKGLRLKRETAGLSLHIDVPTNNDHVIWHKKSAVLIVDRDTDKKIGDAMVDIEEGPEEPRLVLRYKNILNATNN